MGLLDRLRRRSPAEPLSSEGEEARRLLNDLAAAIGDEQAHHAYKFETEFEGILAATQQVHVEVLLQLLADPKTWGRKAPWYRQHPAHELLNLLMRRKLPLDESTLALATERFARNRPWHASEASFVGLIERSLPGGASEPAMLEALERLTASFDDGTQKHRTLRRRLAAVRGAPQETLEPGEPWTDRVLADLAEMPEATRSAWEDLFDLAASGKSSRPSKKWMTAAAAATDAIRAVDEEEPDIVVTRLAAWFDRVTRPRELETGPGRYGYTTYKPPISDINAVYLRGLVWAASRIESPEMLAAIARLAEVCFAKIPDYGAVNRKVGNACVWALGNSPQLEGVAWLARLQSSIRYPSARKLIVKATDEAAARVGMTAQEIEELAVPDFGLGADGKRRQAFGEWTAVLELLPNDKTVITWRRAATTTAKAKKQKSVPKAVKEEFADDIKALRAEARSIRKLLPGQRTRFEGFYLEEREWAYPDWKERYLDQPFTSHLAKRLIWRFVDGGDDARAAIWHDGELVGTGGDPVAVTDDTRVRLWHPLDSEVDEIQAWRRFLPRHGITQPFKQAHREVYILTDAELETGVYSNRFAAHILKQHQLATLLTSRGWTYTLQGGWDSHNVPFRSLERHDLEVQFWVEAISMEDMSPAGIFLYVSSDQVCFTRIDEGERLPLTEVPTLVFSEVMRDVDLFVSVTSLGADPTWSEDRRHPLLHTYWTDFAFGELRARGETRKELLTELLPGLAAAEKLSIEDRWLRVEGKLNNYRVHLGSSSIQRDPGGHVCIVPAPRRSSSKLHLPYEGDSLLSIIVSKALMLVNDDEIEDLTIRQQIR